MSQVVVPVHALGAGDREVRVVEVDDPTEEVVVARNVASEEVGDDLSAEEVVAVPADPLVDTGPASFTTAEAMLRERKREVVENDINDDEEVEVKETDDTSSDDGDEDNDAGFCRCKDCGFQVDLLNPEDLEFCEGNVWDCEGCGKEIRTVSEAKMKCFEEPMVFPV